MIARRLGAWAIFVTISAQGAGPLRATAFGLPAAIPKDAEEYPSCFWIRASVKAVASGPVGARLEFIARLCRCPLVPATAEAEISGPAITVSATPAERVNPRSRGSHGSGGKAGWPDRGSAYPPRPSISWLGARSGPMSNRPTIGRRFASRSCGPAPRCPACGSHFRLQTKLARAGVRNPAGSARPPQIARKDSSCRPAPGFFTGNHRSRATGPMPGRHRSQAGPSRLRYGIPTWLPRRSVWVGLPASGRGRR